MRGLGICLILLSQMMDAGLTSTENVSLGDINANLKYLRLGIVEKFKNLNKKLEWTLADGKPAPNNASRILETFDIYGSERNAHALWSFVRRIPDDTIVLVSVLDDASTNCKEICYDAIREIGGTQFPLAFRDGYALIGYRGTYCGSRPPWMKEMRKKAVADNRREGRGIMPISLISEIDLDHCY